MASTKGPDEVSRQKLHENEWQSCRTKKTPTFEFTSISHEYKKTGKYKVMVKVVDIMGIDTSKILQVRV